MRRDEFEGRNRQLPADLDQTMAYANSAQAREDFQVTPQGTPPDCYDVRSVYDVRPINGFDFNITSSALMTFGVKSTVNPFVEFTVPEGFVCVLREVDIWFNPIPPGSTRNDKYFDLTLNGGSVPYNQTIYFGVASGKVKVFMIANEFDRVGVHVVDNANTASGSTDVYCQFYGNFLPKTERPSNFEIANRVMSGQCAPESSKPKRATLPPPVAERAPVIETRAPVIETRAPEFGASAVSPPKIGVVNVVSQGKHGAGAGGGGGKGKAAPRQAIAVFDPAHATAPGGFRAITRQEYAQFKTDFDVELQKLKKFAPSAALWLE